MARRFDGELRLLTDGGASEIDVDTALRTVVEVPPSAPLADLRDLLTEALGGWDLLIWPGGPPRLLRELRRLDPEVPVFELGDGAELDPALFGEPEPGDPHRPRRHVESLFITEDRAPSNDLRAATFTVRRTWLVKRLWRLAEGLPVELAPVDDFDLDQVSWWRPGELPSIRSVLGHCRRILDADPTFPVIVSTSGVIMDGKHRLARAVLDGQSLLRAVRFGADPAPDRLEILSGAQTSLDEPGHRSRRS
ncbi:MAG: hypothetical protein AAGF23_03455 [Acidobacteriota bacterium]